MKKQPVFRNSLFLLIVFLCLGSCKSGTSISHQDSLKIKAWDLLFNKTTPLKSVRQPFDQSVDATLATNCVNRYITTYYGSGTTPAPVMADIQKSYTYAVAFQSAALSAWLLKTASNTNIKMNNIRVCFGIYTPEYVTKYSIDASKVGRLTVFLWPYLDDKPSVDSSQTGALGDPPVDPFNLGSLYP